ncbi:hypothetical protein AQUCO_20900002v1 [Aquilegia coerulea]|uniref:Neprosin PEP catalytic domain-containing protein n=1 Tax=Aquilegia coerulea TaxID=218851 RepID=A0A2G5C0Q6_AQUCA|nr:hypothetical protein AQUCO_20900002v1 [Aquilegia coerulea]
MAFKVSLFLFFVALVVSSLCNFEVDGRRILSKDEDLELEQQLNVLNKPMIKTIQDESGDLFDCIDINMQPALDHPLLKDHKIQMKPTSHPKSLAIKSSSTSQRKESPKALLRKIGCPEGTVPIQRTKKEDLIRAKSFGLNFPMLTTEFPGQHLAGIYSTGAATFYGAQASMNLINPKVTEDQSSMAIITIVNNNKVILAAGWAVAPKLYGDHDTHLITYWKGDNNSGCYNLMCPGFVLVENHYGFQVKQNISVLDGPQNEMEILIWHDNQSDSWWVSYPNVTKDHTIDIGYWPGSLVPGLSKGASSVEFGGLTQGPANGPSAPMGYGTFPKNNFKLSGYFAEMQIIDQNGYLTGLVGSWEEFADSPQCYGVKNYGKQDDDNGYVMEYGGPGGSNCGK